MFQLKPKSNGQMIFEIVVYIFGMIISIYSLILGFTQGKIDWFDCGLIICFVFTLVVRIKALTKSRKNEMEFIARYDELMGDSEFEDELNDTDEMILDDLFDERDLTDE